MYNWRNLSERERGEIICSRIQRHRPWHTPPRSDGAGQFHISAACYEHRPHIGFSCERMSIFGEELLTATSGAGAVLHAWCVLPNHYHLLITVDDVRRFTGELGRLHGSSSYRWNGEEQLRGRQVFHSASDREIRSHRHFWATLNYVHHNPVKHGYVKKWEQWPWSSAIDYLEKVGREQAKNVWESYPILGYGAGWDESVYVVVRSPAFRPSSEDQEDGLKPGLHTAA